MLFLKPVIDLIVWLVDMIKTLIGLVTMAVNVFTSLIGMLPAEIAISAGMLILVCVIYKILGRENQS